jgi:hypothetical protein
VTTVGQAGTSSTRDTRVALETLVAAAVKAPSGDNLQPWRFRLDGEASRITLYVDETRDPSPMNAGQRMSRVAVGAALENILQSASSRGWTVELEAPLEPAAAALRLTSFDGDDPEDPAIGRRVTNRRAYDRRPIPPEILERLQRQTPELDGVRTHWICDRARLERLADLIGRADALMFGEPSMRRAFLHNIRFDQPWDAEVQEGLPIASLELSRADRVALRMLRFMPHWLFRLARVKRKFKAAARRLIESSSGLCLIVFQQATPQANVFVGRAMERAWLALAREKLAAQPMMSLAVLENLLSTGTPRLPSRTAEKAIVLAQQFREILPTFREDNLGFIMRFGFAPAPTASTSRLPLGESVTRPTHTS